LYTIKTILFSPYLQKIPIQLNEIGKNAGNSLVPAQAAWLYKAHCWYNFTPGSVEAAPYWSGIPAQRR
jgi:hypothetical protein